MISKAKHFSKDCRLGINPPRVILFHVGPHWHDNETSGFPRPYWGAGWGEGACKADFSLVFDPASSVVLVHVQKV